MSQNDNEQSALSEQELDQVTGGQASSGVPLFGGNSQGGSGVRAAGGTGKCSRDLINRPDTGIAITTDPFSGT